MITLLRIIRLLLQGQLIPGIIIHLNVYRLIKKLTPRLVSEEIQYKQSRSHTL